MLLKIGNSKKITFKMKGHAFVYKHWRIWRETDKTLLKHIRVKRHSKPPNFVRNIIIKHNLRLIIQTTY